MLRIIVSPTRESKSAPSIVNDERLERHTVALLPLSSVTSDLMSDKSSGCIGYGMPLNRARQHGKDRRVRSDTDLITTVTMAEVSQGMMNMSFSALYSAPGMFE